MAIRDPSAYPGSKNGSGVCERLISWMPVHRVYIAGFAGHDAVFFRKRPAAMSIMVDRDESVCQWWKKHQATGVRSVCCDLLEVASEVATGSAGPVSSPLASLQTDLATLKLAMVDRDTLLYLDPPYLRSLRGQKRLWRYDMDDAQSHAKLLKAAMALPCMVMISGYPSTLYDRFLHGWRCDLYKIMTRGGTREECAWMNYPAGLPLHDCRYVGDTFRGRERLKRRCSRWVKRFRAMPQAERQVILEALTKVVGPGRLAAAIVGNGEADRIATRGDCRGLLRLA